MMTEEERFEAKIAYEALTGCWLWVGARLRAGYGKFGEELAHRYSYRSNVGALVPGMVIDHLCRNTCCVNPGHLQQVTQRENLMRGQTLTFRYATATHCTHGHELTPDNLYLQKGRRRCKTCQKASSSAGYYARKVK